MIWRLPLGALLLCLAATPLASAGEEIQVGGLTCEYLVDPVGIDVLHPRLSWLLSASEPERRGLAQTAYQVLVATSEETLARGQGDLWDSGRVESDQSVHVVYAGKPLASRQRCYWKVRVWDNQGHDSGWSEPAFWSMGILSRNEWQAQWLGYGKPLAEPTDWRQEASSPLFRKTFDLEKPVERAVVSVCGLGYHELRLNGAKVGDHVLDPAFTRYDKRALYVTYDITESLKQGKNAVGVMLGNGWYNMHTRAVWDFDRAPWRDRPTVLLNLHVEFADGTSTTVASDLSWRAATGPVVLDGIRNGEFYDARLEMPGWDTPDFDDSAWAIPDIVPGPKGVLRAQMMPPIRVMQTVTPVSVAEPKPGVFVFDMGQNMAGWAQLRVSGPAGTKVVLRYAERLAADGTLDSEEIGKYVKQGPFQTDAYVLKGEGLEVWEPRFTYHGFRYVEVTGFPGTPTRDSLWGRVVHTSFESAGSFRCSSELLNAIQAITRRAYRSNYHGYPTDCPQREKNGWTGDAHLAAEQALYNFDNAASYLKWMNDFQDEQQDDGNLPGIVPTSGWGYHWGNGPAWDSAYVLIPWYLYLYRGDVGVLAEHYEGMKRYVDFMTGKAKGHLVEHGLGDWVPARTETPVIVTSSAYYYVDATIVSKAAALLGNDDDARRYAELAEAIRKAFNRALYRGDGLYANGSQTALSCTLFQGLVEPSEREAVVRQLVANVGQNEGHLDTGILGAKYLFHALTEQGRVDVAYQIATQTTPPSYGDWIARGATTLWEDWPGEGSLNHVMFGDISAWFYKALAGILVDPQRPGFKHVIIRPSPVGDLTSVEATHDSMYGTIRSSWELDGGRILLSVTVPVNATATVYLPAQSVDVVTERGRPPARDSGVDFLRMENGRAVLEIGSGNYRFEALTPTF